MKMADPNSNLGLLIPNLGSFHSPPRAPGSTSLFVGIDIINNSIYHLSSFPGGTVVKNPPAKAERLRFDPWVGKILWRRKWQPAPVFLPGKFHRQRSLAGYRPWGHKELDITEHSSLFQIIYPSPFSVHTSHMTYITLTHHCLVR